MRMKESKRELQAKVQSSIVANHAHESEKKERRKSQETQYSGQQAG